MSGPGLKEIDAHTSIHVAALHEARALTDLFQQCIQRQDIPKSLQVAEVIIEHWESRTLKHAESEEEGLYKDAVREKPELKDTVIELTRDHHLMRRLVSQIKSKVNQQIIDDSLVKMMDALIMIDEIHNDDEMENLLPHV